MAQTSVKIKPATELVELVNQYPASNVTALERAADLAAAAARLSPFGLGDVDPIVIPRSVLRRILEARAGLVASLEPFTEPSS